MAAKSTVKDQQRLLADLKAHPHAKIWTTTDANSLHLEDGTTHVRSVRRHDLDALIRDHKITVHWERPGNGYPYTILI